MNSKKAINLKIVLKIQVVKSMIEAHTLNLSSIPRAVMMIDSENYYKG